MKKWLARLFWRWVWGKPKKPVKNLRNPAPRVYGPKRKRY